MGPSRWSVPLFGALVLAFTVRTAFGIACLYNAECSLGQYCKKAWGTCTELALGTCEPMPDYCVQVVHPVCGCDGNSYGNDCAAAQWGVNIDYDGFCGRPTPVSFTASDDLAGVIRLEWADVGGELYYTVYRYRLGIPESIGTTPADVTVFEDAGACGANVHWYQVTASYPAGESFPSPSDMGSTVNRPPMADPGGPYAIEIGSGAAFDGTGSSDPDESCGDQITAYRWYVEGQYLGSGATISLSWEQLEALACGGSCQGGATAILSLRVDDRRSGTSEAAATLTFCDNSPHAVAIASPGTAFCGGEITLDASTSSHGQPNHSIVLYEWDFEYEGEGFNADATGARVAFSGYGIGSHTAALRVTDDNIPPKTAIDTVNIVIEDRPPAAAAGGPYSLMAGSGIVLDGSSSHDPDGRCDAIVAYEWDTDADGLFELQGETVSLGWLDLLGLFCGGRCREGTPYSLTLRVTDREGAAGAATTFLTVQPLDVPVRLLAPNGGEMLGSGETYPIRWVSRPDVEIINLYCLWNKSQPWQLVAHLEPEAEEVFEWNVFGVRWTSHNALLKAVGYSGGLRLGRDFSDGPFSLGPVEVLSPGGGDTLTGGRETLVSWNTYRTMGRIRTTEILLSAGIGSPWRRVGQIPGNPGICRWTVPVYRTCREKCRVRVIHRNRYGRLVGGGANRGFFTIIPP